VIAARLDVVAVQVRREHRDHLIGIERGDRAAHRLRASRGARRVLHELTGEAVAGPRFGLAVGERVDRLGARDVTGGEPATARHAGFVGGRGTQLGVARVAEEERVRARVAQDVRDLTRSQVGCSAATTDPLPTPRARSPWTRRFTCAASSPARSARPSGS